MTHKGFSDEDRAKALETQRKNREEKKQEFPATLLECEGDILAACKKHDVSRTQYFAWRKEDPGFERLTNKAILDSLESLIVDIAYGRKKGNFGAACAVLNARGRDRGYGISRQELTGADGVPLGSVVSEEERRLRSLSVDDLKRIRDIIVAGAVTASPAAGADPQADRGEEPTRVH